MIDEEVDANLAVSAGGEKPDGLLAFLPFSVEVFGLIVGGVCLCCSMATAFVIAVVWRRRSRRNNTATGSTRAYSRSVSMRAASTRNFGTPAAMTLNNTYLHRPSSKFFVFFFSLSLSLYCKERKKKNVI